MKKPSWFDLNFPWIGAVAAFVLLGLLFGTDLLVGEPGAARWYDRTWLAWLAMAAYLVHNIEEYGVDLFGRRRGFVAGFNAMLKLPPEPNSPVPPLFFTLVNVPLFWVSAPVAALLSVHHPLVGLVLYSVILINALVHIIPLFFGLGYSSGTLTAFVVFLPLSVWVGHACFGDGKLSYGAMTFLLGMGVFLHLVLMASIQLFIRGKITAKALEAIQVLNAVLLIAIPWLAEQWHGGSLV